MVHRIQLDAEQARRHHSYKTSREVIHIKGDFHGARCCKLGYAVVRADALSKAYSRVYLNKEISENADGCRDCILNEQSILNFLGKMEVYNAKGVLGTGGKREYAFLEIGQPWKWKVTCRPPPTAVLIVDCGGVGGVVSVA